MIIKYIFVKIFLGVVILVFLSFTFLLTKKLLKKEKPVDTSEVSTKLTMDDIFHNDTTYYLITGSFLNEENAIKRQNELIAQGFNNTKIIKEDSIKYYRLCVKVLDNEKMSRFYLDAVRSLYSEYNDAWLIIIVEKK